MEKVPDINRITQWDWMKRTLTRELVDGKKADIGFANEVRLIRVIEMVDWYIAKYGTPDEIVTREDK